MRLREFSICVLLLVPFLAVSERAEATEVYRWTDADGVVHYSQTPPPSEANASKLSLRDPRPSDDAPVEDIYDVAGQQARMQALREERERKRQERLERQREAASRQADSYAPSEIYTYPAWWLRPRPPVRPQPPPDRPSPGPGDAIRPPDMIKPPSPLTPKG
jgi:hypothetical protein